MVPRGGGMGGGTGRGGGGSGRGGGGRREGGRSGGDTFTSMWITSPVWMRVM